TGTTQPPHDPHDYSQLAARWPTDSSSTGTLCPSNAPCDSVFGISTATTRELSYVVYNLGAWAVDLPVCVTPDVNELWAVPAVGVWAPYSKGIWPQPYPARDPVVTQQPCTTQQVKVGPNESITLTTLAVGGYRNAAGDVMPSPPGFTSFQPSYMPQCAQPCATPPNGSLKITVHPGQDPKKNFQVVVKSMHPTAASGGSAPVEITYTNPLGFTVRMPLFGPCWTVKSGPGTADCSRPRASVIVEPHGTVDLVGTLWARSGFTATGAPLAPGRYRIDLGDLEGSQYPFSANYPYLMVTP
ncbi:MAG TPA: hypothetical protein VGP92_05685, partial [Acidimicrobiia bacterium]|nr:hypothetical protein [Acidimicrobiia bacterium]